MESVQLLGLIIEKIERAGDGVGNRTGGEGWTAALDGAPSAFRVV